MGVCGRRAIDESYGSLISSCGLFLHGALTRCERHMELVSRLGYGSDNTMVIHETLIHRL